jgi:hypothetical protein
MLECEFIRKLTDPTVLGARPQKSLEILLLEQTSEKWETRAVD